MGANRDAGEVAGGRGVRATRLRAIRSDIAANLGVPIATAFDFGDVFDFNRSFRRAFGATPSNTRAATRENGDTPSK